MQSFSATRYVLPLREGGSLPAIMETDAGGMYVVKFYGAGQGPLALVAELLTGEIARALTLNVPEIAFVSLDSAFGRNEPDPEIRHLLQASIGTNLGLKYLPAAITFDAAAKDSISPAAASAIVWLDAFVQNVDRTPRNPNLLLSQGQPWVIDHGAALYFQHSAASSGETPDFADKALSPFSMVRDHVLLPFASELRRASEFAHAMLTPALLEQIVSLVPDEWLATPETTRDTDARRQAYLRYFVLRLQSAGIFEAEAEHAHEAQL